ncbi:ATP-dependent helicase C-terminal domain-containing protein [Sporomusa sp. KB1]|uniref:ATP-dependent helicase C-terminal domain-containing protein n=1 Tax=Sporomusa sp. KB1 TaxID=943346 RepID=UPI0011A56F8E|nr:ATP-dependent helicase C-terminal domain-containing protein [Sporomusa sp. KB1]
MECLLSWDERRELDACVPIYIIVPSGQRIPIDYSSPTTPVLAKIVMGTVLLTLALHCATITQDSTLHR